MIREAPERKVRPPTRLAPICFCYNPTSWAAGAPIPGGMADALVRPILPHLTERQYHLERLPRIGAVNVYYAHREKYGRRREPGAAGVFVSHGIADKAWRNAGRVSPHFDWVFVSGPAWTTKLVAEGLDPAKIVEVGYTKLDPVINGELPAPTRDRRVRVVWAPTHGGGGEHSLRTGAPSRGMGSQVTTWWRREEILELLPEEQFDVVEAPHPRHRPDHRATLTEYVGADVVIADGGSTIYEAWALGLPVVFPSWVTHAANVARHVRSFEAQIYRQHVGYHARNATELAPLVTYAARAGITPAEVEFVEQILPARYRGVSGRLHAEALEDIAAGRVPRHRARPARLKFRNRRSGTTMRAYAGTPRAKALESRPATWELVT